jgi:riboflavin transporter FmnP
MEVRGWVTLSLTIILIVMLIRAFSLTNPRKDFDVVRFMTRVAIFGAISAILYMVPLFQIHLPFLPSFLALHFDEIPAFIAGFAYGPWAGFAVILIKTVLKLAFGLSTTMGVGELADLIFSTAFVIPAAIIYTKKRNMKGVALGFLVSTILQLLVSFFLNIYAMLPFYMFVMGFPEQALISMCVTAVKVVNPAWGSLAIWSTAWRWGYGLFAILPLNIIKDAAVIVVTFLVYRSIHKLLHFDRKPA